MRQRRPGEILRWLAVATGAVFLASCRSMTAPVATLAPVAMAARITADDDSDATPVDDSVGMESIATVSHTTSPDTAAAEVSPVRAAGLETPVTPLPRVELAGHAAGHAAIPVSAGQAAIPVSAGQAAIPVSAGQAAVPFAAGSATRSGCRDGRCGAPPMAMAGECNGPACRGGGCGSPRCRLHRRRHPGPCQGSACESCQSGPIVPTVAIPVIGPCLVCDGGDHGKPAVARGRSRLENVTSGDTVARYRATGPDPAPEGEECLEAEACVVASNCTCVYAPRFSSVRRVTRPFEDSVPTGPHGVALDTIVGAKTTGQAVRDKTQPVQLVAARRVQPGIAIEDRIPVLAVDKVQPPRLKEAFDGPVNVALDQPVERLVNVQAPRLARKIDVPLAWMCVSGAQVTVNGEAADVLAVDHGVATLRLESPGRSELTLCKRAGTDAVRPGEELDFTIYLLNSGDRPLTDITLADAVPGRLEVIEGSPASNLPATTSTAKAEDGSTVITWTFKATLKPGEGGFVRFRTLVH